FFLSSRRRHTIFSRDWSSDVCSSYLAYHLTHHKGQLHLDRQGSKKQEAAYIHPKRVYSHPRRPGQHPVQFQDPAQKEQKSPHGNDEQSGVLHTEANKFRQHHLPARNGKGHERIDGILPPFAAQGLQGAPDHPQGKERDGQNQGKYQIPRWPVALRSLHEHGRIRQTQAHVSHEGQGGSGEEKHRHTARFQILAQQLAEAFHQAKTSLKRSLMDLPWRLRKSSALP